ncbi:MBL fold metallo-hydrolase [Rossellomorea aquimaris]|nr:MBL fold metallo-hydrolase [Rossellomorea aquimaris]
MSVLFIISALILVAFLVLRFYPVFGQKPSRDRVSRSPQHVDGSFRNQIPSPMGTDLKTAGTMFRDMLKKDANRKPESALPINEFPVSHQPQQKTNITWFGHSASMIEIDGKHLLLDPMFGDAPSPFPWFGNRRYSKKLPFRLEELPVIDAVLFSHDHYDHLDYGTIKRLKGKVERFFVPLGVGGHLERWGIEPDVITELDWWEDADFQGITFACTPARHFSGRSLNDRNSTLWCSWVIKGTDATIFFSGDSGYGPHFKEIGERFGPFHLTLMECGQYDPRWASIHMLPEETVQAHQDVRGNLLIPIHWGAFTLSFHEWNDPIARVTKAGKGEGIKVITPMIGETVFLHEGPHPQQKWWESIPKVD